ncbi:hypothetical protein SOPP22_02405 [Shewanella sp. OPT22]|nr:hypothetical protein SOPP22_02405 [Shewanella sp. OPT22]
MWRKYHRYLTLVLALPLCSWILSGVALNLIPSDWLTNRTHFKAIKTESTLVNKSVDLAGIEQRFNQNHNEVILEFELIYRLNEPVIKIITVSNNYYYWANRLEPIHLSSAQILALAKQSYSGNANFSEPKLLDNTITRFQPNTQSRLQYVINVDDDKQTSIIVDANTATVITHQNSSSRLKDLFMQLHFLDVNISDGLQFNHWLIRIAALFVILFCVSGIMLQIPKIKKWLR